jgi:hypothetical protein
MVVAATDAGHAITMVVVVIVIVIVPVRMSGLFSA